MTEQQPTALVDHQYDPLNRLTNVLAGGAQAAKYGYDNVGNRLAVTHFFLVCTFGRIEVVKIREIGPAPS